VESVFPIAQVIDSFLKKVIAQEEEIFFSLKDLKVKALISASFVKGVL